MKHFYLSGILLTLCLFLICTGFAEEIPAETTMPELSWAGTWTDVNYTLTLEKNESEVTGIGISQNTDLNDPFLLSGTLSEDGKELTAILKDSGTLTLILSDDQISFTGNGTVDQFSNDTEPYTYTTEGSRNGTILDSENIWSGDWQTQNSSFTIHQSGNSVTGTYYILSSPEGYGIFEGLVSEDGKTLSTTWEYPDNATFALSDDGMYLIETDCEEMDYAAGMCLNLTREL